VEKDADEDAGVTFTADVFDGIRICSNDCDFCSSTEPAQDAPQPLHQG